MNRAFETLKHAFSEALLAPEDQHFGNRTYKNWLVRIDLAALGGSEKQAIELVEEAIGTSGARSCFLMNDSCECVADAGYFWPVPVAKGLHPTHSRRSRPLHLS